MGFLEDPWLSITDHAHSTIYDGFLYGENAHFLAVKSHSITPIIMCIP